ncbi:hypothetical protein Q3O43_21810 [Rhodococcus aetherivorans]|uniref:hypothetical protein n=1 Tax=Rhodococcus aetherivorans TaxID=191292 RepID=UPI0026EC3F41|nr:hypothetical protein [Rhodococcus aetherivorans]WKW97646.1 hypothetical protein Q3O43_21810 [Rhodococcus aetherivorans]
MSTPADNALFAGKLIALCPALWFIAVGDGLLNVPTRTDDIRSSCASALLLLLSVYTVVAKPMSSCTKVPLAVCRSIQLRQSLIGLVRDVLPSATNN